MDGQCVGHFVREISVGYPVIPSLVHFLDLSKLYYLHCDAPEMQVNL